MIWLFALILSFFIPTAAEATARFMTQNGSTSGTCTTSGTACRFDYLVTILACGDTVTMLNGTYTGSTNMLNFGSFPPTTKVCTLGTEITFSAETDGSVFIDGQFSRTPFRVTDMSYWIFQNFDAGNGNITGNGLWLNNSSHIQFKRICISNLSYAATSTGEDLVLVQDSSSNLFEDFCAFGSAGNMIIEFGSGSTNNTYRRVWARWEGQIQTTGQPSDCGGPPFQIGYGAHQTSTYENIITIHDPEQIQPTDACYHLASAFTYGSTLIRDIPYAADTGYTMRGWIMYGYDSPNLPVNHAWFNQAGGGDDNGGKLGIDIVDMFVDALSQPSNSAGPIGLGCVSGSCQNERANRITSIRGTASSTFGNSGEWPTFSNINECTSLSACPNFYTGSVSSTLGARNCFRYSGGTLTSTPLWPWPMDDRIKAALARANAAGTGGSPLAGTALTGAYAANTVTSEIVSRYGSVPTACLTSSSFTPSFPVASDFPSVSVRDDFDRADASTLGSGWTELLGSTFSIVSHAAAAPSTGGAFARALYSDTKLQTSHEVYGTWTTIAADVGSNTIISFAGTDLTVNNQYRVLLDRTTGVNSTIEVRRVDGVGTQTVILSSVDLGIEVVNGNSFGVRVSGTTISVYWKWTDGIWYRIGEFTDSNLASLPSTGVYGGIAGGSPSVIDNFGAGPFVDQPVQEPPAPPSSVGAGRFGTTFPGVR